MKPKKVCSSVFAAVAAISCAFAGPLRATETDDRIESTFKNTYVYKVYLTNDEVNVKSVDGVVTLTGTADDESHKKLAEDTAASLPGVVRVYNQLRARAVVGSMYSDAWIGRQVRFALQLHQNVNVGKITFDVRDGIVTLKGSVANAAQKELTAEYVAGIEGVKGVWNEIVVAAVPGRADVGDILDDASVTAHVMATLMMHRSTSSVITRVATRKGEVTLTGIARSAAEKALIERLVANVNGVIGVKNQMTVEHEPGSK